MFEASHKHQSIANNVMHQIQMNKESRLKYQLDSYGFHRKEDRLPLQAADLFAWHFQLDIKRGRKGLARRKDFAALVSPRDQVAVYSRDALTEMAKRFKSRGFF